MLSQMAYCNKHCAAYGLVIDPYFDHEINHKYLQVLPNMNCKGMKNIVYLLSYIISLDPIFTINAHFF